MNPCIHLWGRTGLGDTIYLRAVVHAALHAYAEVYVSTAWPELFADTRARCVRSDNGLRCQTKNANRWISHFVDVPADTPRRQLKYGWKELRRANIMVQMERDAGILCNPFRFDLPPLPASPMQGRYAVIRPVSVRRDWPNPARNPLPEYVATAASTLKGLGWTIVSVADLEEGKEDRVGDPIVADVRWEHGELDTPSLLALIRGAGLVVGGVGFIVPAVIATQTPAVIIGGGQGMCNSPRALLDRRMRQSRIRWIMPQRYCLCRHRTHSCSKTIPRFEQLFQAALRAVT